MSRRVARILFALGGSSMGALWVALIEGWQTARESTGSHPTGFFTLALADLGVLAPLAVLLGLAVAAASLFLEPARPVGLRERVAVLRAASPMARSQSAAVALLVCGVAVLWLVVTAQTAEFLVGAGAPFAAGAALAVTSIAALGGLAAAGLAVLPTVRRGLASAAARFPRAIDPPAMAAMGLALAVLVVGAGLCGGGTGGEGAGPVAIFGVLRRPELDLRPVFELALMTTCAWLAPMAVARPDPPDTPRTVAAVASLALSLTALALTLHEASALESDPGVATEIERHAALGHLALAALRRATDGDHDGASPYFGGGDCDDMNPDISPFAIEIPGNGIDEDCSGSDLPLPSKGASAAAIASAPLTSPLEGDESLILITVDTLRAGEMGFLGYDKPTTPRLDELAERSVIFERAYSMASYTGKALAPMLIGKYPSETVRDGGHFNKYGAANTFLAERLKAAGFYTMGAAPHWYFREGWGLTQGIDLFDLSAVPDQGQTAVSDSTSTGAQLTDAALKLLAAHAGHGRFFMWVHYFDPHAQYVAHAGAPDFAEGAKRVSARMRAAYDGEVWFTDHHIGRLLDYARGQAWWKSTAVVVTSDHGESMNEHGIAFQHGFEIWEPLVRVPLLIYAAGLPPHRVPVKRSVIDLVPTVLDLLHVPQPPAGELSGQSMLADLLSKPGDVFGERDVFIDMPDGPFTHMRRALLHGPTPGMKLIHFGGRQYQLYDLAADPNEEEDLAGDPARLAPLVQAMQAKRGALHEIYVKPDNYGKAESSSGP